MLNKEIISYLLKTKSKTEFNLLLFKYQILNNEWKDNKKLVEHYYNIPQTDYTKSLRSNIRVDPREVFKQK